MNFGFSMVFLQFGLGGAGVQIVETRIFLRGIVMKASSHEKHAKQQLKNKKTKSSDPWPRSGERPGRGHGSELFVFFVFFGFSMVFCSLAKTSRKPKKKGSDPWARSGLPTHNEKNKQKKQETKKTKN